MPTLREQIHPLLRGLLPDTFDRESFVESKATCDNCVMLAPEGTEKSQQRDFFHPDIKCCTYHPRMPNFLIGAILSDESPEGADGAERVRKLIALRTGVTPDLLGPSRKYNAILDAGRVHGFGRSMRMRCPFFHAEAKNCTIWRYRKSDCAVFYCKYDAGADGQDYWRGVGSYWHLLETRTAALVRERVSTDVHQPDWPVDRMSIEELEDRPPCPEQYKQWWGPFEGREEAFYKACFKQVTLLTGEDGKKLIDNDRAKRRLTIIQDAHEQLTTPTFPERLKVNPDLDTFQGPEGVKIVAGYSRYQPTPLPEIIHRLVHKFDGKATVAEVQRQILEEDDADFADGLVLTMFQQRILIAADRK